MLYDDAGSPAGYAISLFPSLEKSTPSIILKSPLSSDSVIDLMYLLANAPSPISSTESGMWTDATIASRNAHSPMYCIESGMLTVRNRQSLNASSAMADTL